MKQIELPTSQNVILKYELPDLIVRIAAFIIDYAIIGLYMFIITLLLSGFDGDLRMALSILMYLPIMFYTLLLEVTLKGQTFGKKLVGIKRIQLNGKAPELSDYILCWSMRLIEIFSCIGSLAALMIIGSDKNQRLGDKLSNTIVIKTLKSNQSLLKEILKIESSTTEIIYPDVVNFNEDKMLYIKSVLVRNQKYPNDINKSLMKDVANQLSTELRLKKAPHNHKQFLAQLIKDYVVLTR